MRQLLPRYAEEVDLDATYAVPDRPHLRANMVASVDGAASADGRSGGLSGPADKALFATLRGLTDVVLVGAGTVRAENYGPAHPSPKRRAWRRAMGLAEVPPIAVVSGRLDLDPAGRFFTEDVIARPLVLTCAAAPADRRGALAKVADVL